MYLPTEFYFIANQAKLLHEVLFLVSYVSELCFQAITHELIRNILMKFGTAIEHHECLPGIRYGAQSKIQYGHQAAILNSGLHPTEGMTIHHY